MDTPRADAWTERADRLFGQLMTAFWREDRFVARACADGEEVDSQCLLHWIPVMLGPRLPEPVRAAMKAGIERHLTEWGLATEHVDSPLYRESGYWMGPIWAPPTFQIVTGLDLCGYPDLADDIADRFCRMCRRSGFPENFDARTGAPLCDPAYTWTASVFLLLAERLNR